MRILLTIEYDGTEYNGWQSQKCGNTIEQVIESGINKLTGEGVKIIASGRTDAGVHAKGQKAHFDTKSSIPPQKFASALNTILPNDIKIIKSEQVDENFHARYSAKRKTYRYAMYESETVLPLSERYFARIDGGYDFEKMEKACAVLKGEHNFKCFLASGSSVKDTVRTIYESKIVKNGDKIYYTVTGNGFLYNMVRTIVGTILYIGYGKLSIADLETALKTGDRKKVGKTMPAKALTLLSVEYDVI